MRRLSVSMCRSAIYHEFKWSPSFFISLLRLGFYFLFIFFCYLYHDATCMQSKSSHQSVVGCRFDVNKETTHARSLATRSYRIMVSHATALKIEIQSTIGWMENRSNQMQSRVRHICANWRGFLALALQMTILFRFFSFSFIYDNSI